MNNNKLRSIKPEDGKWNDIFMLKDRKSIIRKFRLIIEHSNPTHSYLLKKEGGPICEVCNCSITMEHLINYCSKYNNVRNKLNVNLFEINNELVKFMNIISF